MKSQLRQLKDRFIARLLTRYPSLFRAWEKRSSGIEFDDAPFHPLEKTLETCKVALITTAGVHLKNQQPFDMNNPNGDYSFREIPNDVDPDHIMITHNYYDHSDADKDVNIVLPILPLQSLQKSGEIGSVNHRHFSFMGHMLNDQMKGLMEVTAPEVARLLKEDGVDVAILSPA